VALARAARAAGTTTMVATPHVSWEWPQTRGLEIANAVLLLSRALRAADVEVKVRRGAEVALTRAGDLPDGELQRLRLGAGPWMLVECPFSGSAAGFERALGALEARGHRILLAHPERIAGFQEDAALLERLVSQGMLCQLTAGSLAGALRPGCAAVLAYAAGPWAGPRRRLGRALRQASPAERRDRAPGRGRPRRADPLADRADARRGAERRSASRRPGLRHPARRREPAPPTISLSSAMLEP